MRIRPDGVAEIDASGERPNCNVLSGLRSGEFLALRVHNLVSTMVCRQLTERLMASSEIVDHSDVEGLRVIGLSHFQMARDPELAGQYFDQSKAIPGFLRALASPYASPFDSAVALLAQWWEAGCQFMNLPTEGPLSPFTVRVYHHGVGIEPHQDILSAESPNDPYARLLADQFGANIYLSMGSVGGALELFGADVSMADYKDLSEGPRVVPRESLPDPLVTLTPLEGDLIIFRSRYIHAVTESMGGSPRITVSFFIGLHDDHAPLKIWA